MELLAITGHEASQLHCLRSGLLDAFALAERSLNAVAKELGRPLNGELIGHKIECVRSIKAGPQYSKERRAHIHVALGDFEKLLSIRNATAHAHMQQVRLDDGTLYACFKSLRSLPPEQSQVLMLTAGQFEAIEEWVRKIAGDLRMRVNPASSPPPPLPAAAGDP